MLRIEYQVGTRCNDYNETDSLKDSNFDSKAKGGTEGCGIIGIHVDWYWSS